jgi:hypothetical protein
LAALFRRKAIPLVPPEKLFLINLIERVHRLAKNVVFVAVRSVLQSFL